MSAFAQQISSVASKQNTAAVNTASDLGMQCAELLDNAKCAATAARTARKCDLAARWEKRVAEIEQFMVAIQQFAKQP